MLYLLYYFLVFYYTTGIGCMGYILWNETNFKIEDVFTKQDLYMIMGVIEKKKKVIEEIELSYLNPKKKIEKDIIDDWIQV